MAQLLRGVLIESDIPTIAYITWLDEKQPPGNKIIIEHLSDKQIFIYQGKEDMVREQVRKWQRSNTYESAQFVQA